MKIVEKWLWKIRWAGRWTTTRTPFTEAEIRREHPEATPVGGSRIVIELPENRGVGSGHPAADDAVPAA